MALGPVPMIKAPYACLDLVNSEFADHVGGPEKFDRLPLPEWQRWFLERWGWRAPVPLTDGDLDRLRLARPLLRAVLESAAALQSLNPLLAPAPFVHQVGEAGLLRARPLEEGWAAVLASAALSVLDVDRSRIKVCANPACSWMFYDESLNRSRRWCQANYCGNLVKVRAHRARRPPTSPPLAGGRKENKIRRGGAPSRA